MEAAGNAMSEALLLQTIGSPFEIDHIDGVEAQLPPLLFLQNPFFELTAVGGCDGYSGVRTSYRKDLLSPLRTDERITSTRRAECPSCGRTGSKRYLHRRASPGRTRRLWLE